MSGNMSTTLGMLSDDAGITPRLLQALFQNLEADAVDSCVKVSFIELYNEELRDLISAEETAKLTIYENTSRRGHTTTSVQGVEEKHIKDAADGLKVLQAGSQKRHVASTKCNDLSSRSHTIFTISTYINRVAGDGTSDQVQTGKLHLVDLAGSENIKRSGAENKRAAEAGLINKSLLTLGRVINGLVDRSPHIPYRESKLTRLLQDSLGGRTKTCIIATISPAQDSAEETISTLNYAARAMNIRNKPQLNVPLRKTALLRGFADEIEKLKAELVSHRLREGVYLPSDAYEGLCKTSESRRIIGEEQAAKIEMLEATIRNRAQEFVSLKTAVIESQKEQVVTTTKLQETAAASKRTEALLAAARKSASFNKASWAASQTQVSNVTAQVEQRVQHLRDKQSQHISAVSALIQSFAEKSMAKVSSTQDTVNGYLSSFETAKGEIVEQGESSKRDMDEFLDQAHANRGRIKEQVRASFDAMSAAVQATAAHLVSSNNAFCDRLQVSSERLGRDFDSMIEQITGLLASQKSEAESLRTQLHNLSTATAEQSETLGEQMQGLLEEEQREAIEDRRRLFEQLSTLIRSQAEAQAGRVAARTTILQKSLRGKNARVADAFAKQRGAMDAWNEKELNLMDWVETSGNRFKTKLLGDCDVSSNGIGPVT